MPRYNLPEAYRSGKNADLIIVAGDGGKFRCHRVFLYEQWPRLERDAVETSQGEFSATVSDGSPVVEMIVHWVYEIAWSDVTAETDIERALRVTLSVAAAAKEKYDMEDLLKAAKQRTDHLIENVKTPKDCVQMACNLIKDDVSRVTQMKLLARHNRLCVNCNAYPSVARHEKSKGEGNRLNMTTALDDALDSEAVGRASCSSVQQTNTPSRLQGSGDGCDMHGKSGPNGVQDRVNSLADTIVQPPVGIEDRIESLQHDGKKRTMAQYQPGLDDDSGRKKVKNENDSAQELPEQAAFSAGDTKYFDISKDPMNEKAAPSAPSASTDISKNTSRIGTSPNTHKKAADRPDDETAQINGMHCVCNVDKYDKTLVPCDECGMWFHPCCIGKSHYPASSIRSRRGWVKEKDEARYREEDFSCNKCDKKVGRPTATKK